MTQLFFLRLQESPRSPSTAGIAAIALAELAAGPLATEDLVERARRQERLQRVEMLFEPFPFGVRAARAYGHIYAAVLAAGRNPGPRVADCLTAATAVAEEVPLHTRNPSDFRGLEHLLQIVVVQADSG
ncbi:MAG: VapC toxin family PIN domain ribonuclease [Arachnia propionica]|uniref:PIN domain-containing protein n=1 Tax=Arachnia propionica TaxID=1750 RepID=UPI002706BA6D|nr:VapC toxin family PIN domain ribonuclease [Arachnia propionica]